MKIQIHNSQQYGDVLQALLPPGPAWEWQPGSFGSNLMRMAGEELARLDADVQVVLDTAITRHRPAYTSWHIDEYRRVANEALNGLTETMPRQPCTIGSHVGDRLWSGNAANTTFEVPLVTVDHLLRPARVGDHIGVRLWGNSRSSYVLLVRYYRSVVDPKPIWDALLAFKQAHVFLCFEDITGVGGVVSYAQN